MVLAGSSVFITGAARGIGFSIARRFVAEGARVVIADIDGAAAARAAAALSTYVRNGDATRGAGAQAPQVPQIRAVELDVTRPTDVESAVGAAAHALGRLDVLINNAGVGLTKLFLETSIDDWEHQLRVNLTGSFLCAQAAAKIMIAQGGGAIINIASLSGQRGGVGRAAYGASKAGLSLLTKVMAVELGPLGVRVNEIAPGPVETAMSAVTHDEATRRAYYDRIPMRRYAQQDEIAAAAVFLASSDARFVNGHTLNVDGGFAAAGLMFDLRSREEGVSNGHRARGYDEQDRP